MSAKPLARSAEFTLSVTPVPFKARASFRTLAHTNARASGPSPSGLKSAATITRWAGVRSFRIVVSRFAVHGQKASERILPVLREYEKGTILQLTLEHHSRTVRSD